MDTSTLITKIVAKWESFCYNFRTKQIQFGSGKYTIPQFILDIDWPHGDTDYMCSRWLEEKDRSDDPNMTALCHTFFLGLDEENQKALLRYAGVID